MEWAIERQHYVFDLSVRLCVRVHGCASGEIPTEDMIKSCMSCSLQGQAVHGRMRQFSRSRLGNEREHIQVSPPGERRYIEVSDTQATPPEMTSGPYDALGLYAVAVIRISIK